MTLKTDKKSKKSVRNWEIFKKRWKKVYFEGGYWGRTKIVLIMIVVLWIFLFFALLFYGVYWTVLFFLKK